MSTNDKSTTAVSGLLETLIELLLDDSRFMGEVVSRVQIRITAPAAGVPDDPGEWLTTNRAAKVTDCSPRYLEALRTRGGGPPYSKVGRIVRYNKAALVAWMIEREQANTSTQRARPPDKPKKPSAEVVQI